MTLHAVKVAPTPNDQAIELLEELLGYAKAGKLKTLSLAGTTVDGIYPSRWVDGHLLEQIGMIECLKRSMLESLSECLPPSLETDV